MRRFYKAVAAVAEADGFAVALDGRPIRTPAGHRLLVPTQGLADAIVKEWQAQGETIRPETMPLTQLANSALDRIGPQRPAIAGQLLDYGGTDLLCYRAEGPADLVRRQEESWQPIVDWAAVSLGVALAVTRGVVPVPVAPESRQRLSEILNGMADPQLTALQCAVAAMGSLLLGLALIAGRLNADEAFAAAQLDETYQNECWGEDEEAVRRRESLRADVVAAERYLALVAAAGT